MRVRGRKEFALVASWVFQDNRHKLKEYMQKRFNLELKNYSELNTLSGT